MYVLINSTDGECECAQWLRELLYGGKLKQWRPHPSHNSRWYNYVCGNMRHRTVLSWTPKWNSLLPLFCISHGQRLSIIGCSKLDKQPCSFAFGSWRMWDITSKHRPGCRNALNPPCRMNITAKIRQHVTQNIDRARKRSDMPWNVSAFHTIFCSVDYMLLTWDKCFSIDTMSKQE